ncbi:MAG: hypothetical protein V7K39_13230, partial [Nostoc sp.]
LSGNVLKHYPNGISRLSQFDWYLILLQVPYQWSSSRGPQQNLSSGTTASVQVHTGEIAPIAYVIPLFRSWTGIY